MSLKKQFQNQISHHINGSGHGFEIDDIISGDSFPEDFLQKIIDIGLVYKSDVYPIGTSNPESFEELIALAEFLPD